MRCEHLENPLGLDSKLPRLSWALEGEGRNRRQTAYQILCASRLDLLESENADLWDSGRVTSSESVLIAYAGLTLGSGQRVYWRVRVWDESGTLGQSGSAWWEMGLLEPQDFRAQWIRLEREGADLMPAPMFRQSFRLEKPLKSARLYASARGVYEARLNGKKVGDQVLAPGWTDYDTRVQYQTFDVTALLEPGENAVGAVVGDGWYCGQLGWTFAPTFTRHYGQTPELWLQLHLEYADGSSEWVCTDDTWKTTTGPTLHADLYAGERYDARLEQRGWDRVGFDDASWKPVQVRVPENLTERSSKLVADRAQPVRVLSSLAPVALEQPAPGVYIYDFGQNISGWARLQIQAPAGTEIQMRFSEVLEADGTLYTESLRSAKQTDAYICKGGGLEVWEPRFTFHGFRFLELTGYPGVPTLETVQAQVVASDTPFTGTFECSSALVNKLFSNIVWGQRGNFLSVPTDCPQRDERLGWLGDAQVFIQTACFNADVAAFFTKWLEDVTDAQSSEGAFPDVAPRLVHVADGAPAWGDAGVIVPWTLYRHYGDLGLLERMWQPMTRWMQYLLEANPNYLWLERRNTDFGDWLAQDGEDPANAFGSQTPKDLLATAYWAYDSSLMARMARALGKASEALEYQNLFEHIKTAFREAYLLEDGKLLGDTQTAYVLALHFDLLEPDERQQAGKHLVAALERKGNHLTTGFVGVSYLLPVLCRIGRADLAYTLLLKETFPSWGYSIRSGATTIWERWDGWTEEKGFQDPGMNSFNHYSLGSVGQWLYQTVAGIDSDSNAPGFAHIRITPQPGGGLSYARASLETARGRVSSAWTLEGHSLTLELSIPANTTATVRWPYATETLWDAQQMEQLIAGDAERRTFLLGSGNYRLEGPAVQQHLQPLSRSEVLPRMQ